MRVHDFVPELGRAVPNGVHDIADNAGWATAKPLAGKSQMTTNTTTEPRFLDQLLA
jgi:hypothetical protein